MLGLQDLTRSKSRSRRELRTSATTSAVGRVELVILTGGEGAKPGGVAEKFLMQVGNW